jgi:hypothetical protein
MSSTVNIPREEQIPFEARDIRGMVPHGCQGETNRHPHAIERPDSQHPANIEFANRNCLALASLFQQEVRYQVSAEREKQAKSHSACVCTGHEDTQAAMPEHSDEFPQVLLDVDARVHVMKEDQEKCQEADYIQFRPIVFDTRVAG